jgi:hypothetical protein
MELIKNVISSNRKVDHLGEVDIVENYDNLSVEGRVFARLGWTRTIPVHL